MKIGDTVRIKDLSQISKCWRGQTAIITKVVPTKHEFGTIYWLSIQGIDLSFFEYEVEEISQVGSIS